MQVVVNQAYSENCIQIESCFTPLSKAVESVVCLLSEKGCSSSVGPPTLKRNNFPDLPRQAVYLPPHDDKQPKLDLGGREEDTAYPQSFIESLLRTPFYLPPQPNLGYLLF